MATGAADAGCAAAVGPAKRLRPRWAGELPGVLVILLAGQAMLYPLWSNPTCAGEDDVLYCYPLRALVGEALREGRWPLHNRLEATGGPLLADPQSATMFPLVWLSAVMNLKLAYALSVFITFAVAGLGAYAYLRTVVRARAAALLGAMAFMFSGFMVGHRVHLTMIQTAAFFPWSLWCVEMLRRRRSGLAWAALTAVLWLAIVAGHWAILVYMGLAWAAYLVFRARPLGRSVALFVAAGVLAALMAAPQVEATLGLYRQATRRAIGYGVAGENSFFPAAGVLAFFPLLMGSPTPGFYGQSWWGSWHLSEMLPYVGLVTLVLAGAAAARLAPARPAGREEDSPLERERRSLARCWTVLLGGALVWALGYYLPTYRLIYHLPVLGVVRCPARMLLVVDMGLAALAALGLEAATDASAPLARRSALLTTIRRASRLVLPLAMLAALSLVGAGALAARAIWPDGVPGMSFFAGTSRDALAAVQLANPAVWAPLAMLLATVGAVAWWRGAPARRAWVLVALLGVDLFSVARFVDVPPAGQPVSDPSVSATAAWLHEHADLSGARVYGISSSRTDQPAELLLPKTGQALGVSLINSYGAWHSGHHAHLLGFDTYGRNLFWEHLVRRNYLLSLYGVRYLLAGQPEIRSVIESVRIPDRPAEADGPNLLDHRWELRQAAWRDQTLRLRSRMRWLESQAGQPIQLEAGRVYRIGLDARGPDDGAAFLLKAEVLLPRGGGWRPEPGLAMEVHPEQTGEDWRHFEWVFTAPGQGAISARFIIHTQSERPVEARNIWCRASRLDQPANLGGHLAPGEQVYRPVALIPSRLPGEPPVAIYENRLALAARPAVPADSQAIEKLRWLSNEDLAQLPPVLPDISLTAPSRPGLMLRIVALPAAGVYLLALASICRRRRGGGSFCKPPAAQARTG